MMTKDRRRSQSRRISIPEGGVEEIICPEEVNLSTIVVEVPKPQASQGANQSQTAKRSPRSPSHTKNAETDECFGGKVCQSFPFGLCKTNLRSAHRELRIQRSLRPKTMVFKGLLGKLLGYTKTPNDKEESQVGMHLRKRACRRIRPNLEQKDLK